MKLVWTKIMQECLVGELDDHSSVGAISVVYNPMLVQYVNMPAPSAIHKNQPPQMVMGFKFLPIPCSEIFLSHVDYAGEIKKHDAVYVTYYKVLEAQKKNDESPLMVTQ